MPDHIEGRSLALELWTGLTAVRRTLRRIARRPFSLRSLTGAELELVRVIDQQPQISVAEAARELGVAANTVSTLVRHLASDGVLERMPDDTDRRMVRLQLTQDVRREVDAWEDRRIVILTDALNELSVSDQTALGDVIPVLQKVAALLGELED